MTSVSTTYIALGSNEGNRLDFLQKAVNAVYQKIGAITKVSAIYKTPALGFKGNEFLNACIAVNTYLSPQKVMQTLLEIELKLGRQRSTQGYTNRTIDLDLLFYDDKIIESYLLTLPHPRIQERRFVLQPLNDIADDLLHPILKKTISEILKNTTDSSKLIKTIDSISVPKISFGTLNFLAIEGNIGAGKTSLSTMISREFNAKLITERFKDNPFLPKFYKNKARYAFPLEMSFLADRYQQLIDDIAQFDLFNNFVVSDYHVYKSMIFAQITLQEEEILLYKKLFNIIYKDLAKPDLYVYLYQNTERLLRNIKKRGRDYEQSIPADYLNNINRGYLNFIKTQSQLNIKIIDISNLDFVANREDFLYLVKKITENLPIV